MTPKGEPINYAWSIVKQNRLHTNEVEKDKMIETPQKISISTKNKNEDNNSKNRSEPLPNYEKDLKKQCSQNKNDMTKDKTIKTPHKKVSNSAKNQNENNNTQNRGKQLIIDTKKQKENELQKNKRMLDWWRLATQISEKLIIC